MYERYRLPPHSLLLQEGEPVEGGEQAEAVAAEGAAAEEAVEAPPAAPPHYVPPEVGEDYVPVALVRGLCMLHVAIRYAFASTWELGCQQ